MVKLNTENIIRLTGKTVGEPTRGVRSIIKTKERLECTTKKIKKSKRQH